MDSASDTASMAIWTVPGYRHERELGSGATGRVMLARHEATGTPVAIKYLVRSLHLDADFRLAYRNEAVLLGALHSPNVANLYEYVEAEHAAAIVMELVEGISLRELLRAEGATAPEAALVVLKGSLLGLAAAHEAGVVHRDFKPENVLVTPQGESKLVDFGIAARSGDTGAAAGTPLYMAPEQFAGQPAEPPADVYAATITFFECVTGSRPYTGTTVNELMIQHTQSPIPDELAPEHVRPLIRTGLAKAPQDRPTSAAEFVEALEDVARAGYGEDWEERGQRKLATLVAMLPLLLLGGAPDIPAATTDLATTNLGPGSPPSKPKNPPKPSKPPRKRRRHLSSKARKALISTVAAGAAIGAIAAVAAARGNGTNDAGPGTIAAGYGATTGATTSVAPTQNSGFPSSAAGPSGAAGAHGPSSSPSASSTTSALSSTTSPTAAAAQTSQPSGTSTTSPASGGGSTATATPTNTSTTVTTPTTPATSTSPAAPPPPPTLHVSSVSINSLGCSGRSGAAATVQVLSNGAATGTLYLKWFYIDVNGGQDFVETDPVTLQQGVTDFINSTPYYHSFGSTGVYWGLVVSTNPAAAKGNDSSSTVLTATCEIQ